MWDQLRERKQVEEKNIKIRKDKIVKENDEVARLNWKSKKREVDMLHIDLSDFKYCNINTSIL